MLISSRSNPKIKQAHALRGRKERQATGLFLVEGIRPVGDAVESGAGIAYLLYSPELLTSEFALGLLDTAGRQGIECLPTTAEIFTYLADKENPQGILAVVRQPGQSLESLQPANFSWVVALVAPQDPGNIGTVLRTVDAVGADGLLLLDSSADPYHPSAVRASMGALFWKPVVHATFAAFSRWANEHRYHVYGTSARGSVDYREVDVYDRPAILLMGSEREGLSEEQRDRCELLLRLPMEGRGSSLNLAVATGVLLYHMLERLKVEG